MRDQLNEEIEILDLDENWGKDDEWTNRLIKKNGNGRVSCSRRIPKNYKSFTDGEIKKFVENESKTRKRTLKESQGSNKAGGEVKITDFVGWFK